MQNFTLQKNVSISVFRFDNLLLESIIKVRVLFKRWNSCWRDVYSVRAKILTWSLNLFAGEISWRNHFPPEGSVPWVSYSCGDCPIRAVRCQWDPSCMWHSLKSVLLITISLQTQCVTDRLKTGDKLTVPVFTDICSAVCWGESVGRIHDCPYNGRRWTLRENIFNLYFENIS